MIGFRVVITSHAAGYWRLYSGKGRAIIALITRIVMLEVVGFDDMIELEY